MDMLRWMLVAGWCAGAWLVEAAPVSVRVNCGGGRHEDRLGRVFEADAPFTEERGWGHIGGRASRARGETVTADAEEPELFLSDRWGVDAYRFRVEPGIYRVTLFFSEFHFTEPGRRVFDVLLNGRVTWPALDIVAAAGTNRALARSAVVRTDDGWIEIAARDLEDRNKFSAIAIEPEPPDTHAPPAPAGITVHPRGHAIGLEWGPVEADDLQGYLVEWRVAGTDTFARLSATPQPAAYAVDTGLPAGVTAEYRVVAVDYFGNESAPGPIASAARADPAWRPTVTFNAGGPAVQDAAGTVWDEDRAYNAARGAGWMEGRAGLQESAVAEPGRTVREGEWAYRFDVAPGIYEVTLGWHEPADRVAHDRRFHIWLNDFLAWADLDVAAQYGAGRPVELTRTFRVEDEGLVVRAQRRHGEPALAWLRVVPAEADGQAPAAPSGVRVEARDEVVHVAWDPVPERDVVGYRVLRAEGEPRAFTTVARGLAGTPQFVDRAVRNGERYHYQIAAVDAGGRESAFAYSSVAQPAMPDDEALLDLISRAAFAYFAEQCDPKTFLTRDKNTEEQISVAAVGFGLAAHVVGAERGWMPRETAARRVVAMLEALDRHPGNRHRGMFFHFLNPDGSHTTGGYEDGASTVDTALLVWGALSAGEYFGGRARELADRLAAEVDWRAFADPARKMVTMIYRPSQQAFDGLWNYYTDEALLVTLLGIGAPRPEYRLEPEYFFAFQRERRAYKDIEGLVCSWSGALFTYTFAHAWLDFRALGPDRPDALGLPAVLQVDWWENTVKAVRANRAFCMAMSRRFRTFGEDAWGLTASSGPDESYVVGGSPPCGDAANPGQGTLALYGAGMAVPFLTTEALAALRNYYTWRDERGVKRLWRDEFDGGYGFIDAFNLDRDWFSPEVQAINHGPMLLLIENHRSGLLWRVTLRHPLVRDALRRAGWNLPE